MMKYLYVLQLLFIFSHRLPATYSVYLPQYLINHIDKTSVNYTDILKTFSRSVTSSGTNVTSLKHVFGIFRHGGRSPKQTFREDKFPFNDSQYWPSGPHEVTKVGKYKMYQLGKTLRKRYNGFLDRKYIANDIVIKSNVVVRDYMSAACLLAGLYPPEGHQLWNPDILWQPIPIWEQTYDIVEVITKKDLCPAFQVLLRKAREALDEYSVQYQELFSKLNSKSGKNITTITSMYKYCQMFEMQTQNGYSIPNWAFELLPELRKICATAMAGITSATPFMTKLLAGPIVNDLTKELREKVGNLKQSDLKVHLEAVHETTVNALLPALGIREPVYVNASALVLLELHKINDKKYTVHLFYFENGNTTSPYVLQVESCDHPCELDKFLQILDAATVVNWGKTCNEELAVDDVVVTSYSILQKEIEESKLGPLLLMRWDSVILDEAHVIRNYKCKTAQAAFLIKAVSRWTLTGTPVHNKELDFYSLLKFLRFRPIGILFLKLRVTVDVN